MQPYWLLEGGQRVGTLALSTTPFGGRDLRVSSFYVLPALRGRGIGGRALSQLAALLEQQRAGFRLDTHWTWQRTVRFYLRQGLWLYMWKRALTFCGAAKLPRPRIVVGTEEATLSIPREDAAVVLARAWRRPEGLALDPIDRALEDDPQVGQAYFLADSTLALALALEGWPLQKKLGERGEAYWADAGAPEALAYKIMIWEAWDRAHGWPVETPRIPGLRYPTWAELNAEWDARSTEDDAPDAGG